MTFLEIIFDRLQKAANAPVMREVHDGQMISVTGSDLLAMVQQARQFLVAGGLIKGDRCALLAPNSIRWTALDLAILAEGLIVVPLYARQAPAELVDMMKDAMPARICCFDAPTPQKSRSSGRMRQRYRFWMTSSREGSERSRRHIRTPTRTR
jgi:long-subunit acyl-CoA synthetase (AMP-forming)